MVRALSKNDEGVKLKKKPQAMFENYWKTYVCVCVCVEYVSVCVKVERRMLHDEK